MVLTRFSVVTAILFAMDWSLVIGIAASKLSGSPRLIASPINARSSRSAYRDVDQKVTASMTTSPTAWKILIRQALCKILIRFQHASDHVAISTPNSVSSGPQSLATLIQSISKVP